MWWRKGSRKGGRRAVQKRDRSGYRDRYEARRLCPRCGSREVRRSRRRSQWEWLLRAIRLYPFRCEGCKHRFLRFSLYGR